MSESVPVIDRFRMDGKVVVVTGASSGLGVAFAQAFAEAGADLVLGARRADRLDATKSMVEGLGRKAIAVPTDVTSPESCTALAQAAIDEFGRLDVLINNAGIGTAVPALKETPEQFLSVLDINLNGVYWMAQACARVMQPGSNIVNVSSVLGLIPSVHPQAAYASSKAAVIGLTRDLAAQWTGRKGIRVNTLAPGFFPSEMTDQYDDSFNQMMAAAIPSKRLGDPAELAAACVFLASDAASYVSGITLVVDGGLTMR